MSNLENRDTKKQSNHIATEPDSIPDSLKQDRHWLVVSVPTDSSGGNPPLAPDSGRCWSDESPELYDFEEAYERALEVAQSTDVKTENGEQVALAYQLTADGPYTCIEFDGLDAYNNLSSNYVRSLLRLFGDGYTEHTVSGDGTRIITEADARGGSQGKHHISGYSGATVEVHDRDQYLVCTGDKIGSSQISGCGQKRVDALLQWVNSTREERSYLPICSITKEQFLSLIDGYEVENPQETRARRVIYTAERCGDKFEYLFQGSVAGYSSQSDAEMALAEELAFWCGGDLDLMDKCFRRSALYDSCDNQIPKWDTVVDESGETYGEQTLRKAKQGVEEHSDAYVSPPHP